MAATKAATGSTAPAGTAWPHKRMDVRPLTHLDIPAERDYIVARALEGTHTMVQLGCLLLVAHERGDAFALDLEDKFACPLCLNGKKQPFPLTEAETQWRFQWPWRYRESRGRLVFERTGNGEAVAIRLAAGEFHRRIEAYNRKAGTSYRLYARLQAQTRAAQLRTQPW